MPTLFPFNIYPLPAGVSIIPRRYRIREFMLEGVLSTRGGRVCLTEGKAVLKRRGHYSLKSSGDDIQ